MTSMNLTKLGLMRVRGPIFYVKSA